METFLVKALQLILSLSILVLVHEFGHFIFARIFKVRVEKFYLFFDPWFSIFKFKPKNSETEYGVGWLPLGGYCKISGMIDESMDKEAMAQPPKPYEFRSKPAGQRLMIMIAGVLFNFLLALFIYSMVLFTWGDTYLPLKNVKAGMDYSETNQAEKNKQDAISWLKTYQKENGGAFNTVAYKSSKEAYDANVDTVKDSKKSILVVYYVSGEHYAVGKIQYGDTVPKTLKKFGKGTKNAPRGFSIINDGNQYSGELVNFRGGEQVIPADKSIKLIDGLTDLTESDLGRLLLENGSMQAQSFLEPFKQSLFDNNALQNLNNMKQVDNSITISNINMYETENVNDFVKQLNRQLPLAAKKIKR